MKLKSIPIIFFSLIISVININAQSKDWKPLFEGDLSDAIYPEGVWSFDNGILTATEDQCIWTVDDYDNFELELEFCSIGVLA